MKTEKNLHDKSRNQAKIKTLFYIEKMKDFVYHYINDFFSSKYLQIDQLRCHDTFLLMDLRQNEYINNPFCLSYTFPSM